VTLTSTAENMTDLSATSETKCASCKVNNFNQDVTQTNTKY